MMRILVTYLPDDRLTDIPTIEFNADTGEILVDGVKPREFIEFRLVGLAIRLQHMYELLKKERDKC